MAKFTRRIFLRWNRSKNSGTGSLHLITPKLHQVSPEFFSSKKWETAKCSSIFLSSKSFARIGNFACKLFFPTHCKKAYFGVQTEKKRLMEAPGMKWKETMKAGDVYLSSMKFKLTMFFTTHATRSTLRIWNPSTLPSTSFATTFYWQMKNRVRWDLRRHWLHAWPMCVQSDTAGRSDQLDKVWSILSFYDPQILFLPQSWFSGKWFPYHACMVYLPTFGWFLWYM